MKIHTPTTPFDKIDDTRTYWTGLKQVRELTEDQCRYALCAALTLGFGNPYCNLADFVLNAGLAKPSSGGLGNRMNECRLILAQIGMGRENPDLVANVEQEVLQALKEE